VSDIIFEAVCATLDELNSCVILLSGDARVLYANRAGGEMLEAGWPVRQVKGYLQGRDRLTTASILSGLESIVRNRLSSLAKVRLNICLAPPANGANTVLGAMAALPGGEITSAKSAVASFFITQASERLEWSAAGLSEGYNLTPAETRTLEQITKGGTLLESARRVLRGRRNSCVSWRNFSCLSARSQKRAGRSSGVRMNTGAAARIPRSKPFSYK